MAVKKQVMSCIFGFLAYYVVKENFNSVLPLNLLLPVYYTYNLFGILNKGYGCLGMADKIGKYFSACFLVFGQANKCSRVFLS